MPFVANIPQPTDFLSDSQEDLRQNNIQLDASFGIDHYTFSNVTTNNGKHNQVTTPLIIGAAHPTTTATDLKFYAMQDTANLGLLQYSRGINNAVPTPITYLHSPSTPISLGNGLTTNVLDFTGITLAICTLRAFNDTNTTAKSALSQGIIFSQNTFSTFLASGNLIAVNSGNILQIKNNFGSTLSDIYWSLEITRIQV